MVPSNPQVPRPKDGPRSGEQPPLSDTSAPGLAAPPWIVLGAGSAATVGSFLPWASVSGPFMGTISASGVDGTADGWIIAALGLVLAGSGTLILRGQRMPTAVRIVAVLAALALLGLGLGELADLSSAEESMRHDLASASEVDVFGIGESMIGAVQVRVGTGLWLINLAGLVGSMVTILMLWTGRPKKQPTGT